MKLSILIATVVERSEQLSELLKKFNYEISYNQLQDEVELVIICDNKEMSIGEKRQRLLEKAQGQWIVFFDDDDIPAHNYCQLILNAITDDIDCIGINGTMTTNGDNPQTWCHKFGEVWRNGKAYESFTYYRPIIHFNPVLKSKALQAGFKNIRFGEDQDYSNRLNLLLTKSNYISEPLFHYNYSNKQPHKQKYGIK